MSASTLNDPLSATRDIADLPGPRGLPLLGNALQLSPATIHLTMERWSRQYGPLFRARLGPNRVLVLSDSAAIAAVLRDRPDGFRRPAVTADVSNELGGNPGVFLAEGEAWRQQRRMVMHGFSPAAVKAYLGRMTQVAVRLQRRWDDAAAAGGSADLSGDMKRYAVDVIAGLAFGADVDTVASGGDAIQGHVEVVLAGVARRSLSPVPYWRWLRLPAERRLERSVAAVRAATDGFIAQARAALDADPVLRQQPANLLQAMLAAADLPDSGVDDVTVAGNVSTMLLAGEDTTSSALAWLVWLLARHPEALARAQQEVLAHAPDVAAMTKDAADALQWIEACTLEAMRLKPPAPFLPLQALRDTTILDVRVPKDTLVWCVMRHDSVDAGTFPEPERFRPERWLPGGDADRQAALPFGGGPRMCPGRYLSLMEVKVALAALLGRFDVLDVRTADGAAPRERMGFVMSPTPLTMTLRARPR
ncbi:cytochrome P450 [Pseudoduganella lurida]|uniref:Cytochrome P450 n=1 Tax=Pseudoduganella lurida TaxID=1036180 RepID=A0A562RKT1_9BURK|nr:cytochrome P450 [Pseudoduganella lurida]TWI69657.1 cytochrome P450 [Pseudoduganella lurida]